MKYSWMTLVLMLNSHRKSIKKESSHCGASKNSYPWQEYYQSTEGIGFLCSSRPDRHHGKHVHIYLHLLCPLLVFLSDEEIPENQEEGGNTDGQFKSSCHKKYSFSFLKSAQLVIEKPGPHTSLGNCLLRNFLSCTTEVRGPVIPPAKMVNCYFNYVGRSEGSSDCTVYRSILVI